MTRLKVWFTNTNETVVFENVAGYRVMWDESKKEQEAEDRPTRHIIGARRECGDCNARFCPLCTYQPDN